jgi:undecaprenyl-diphosphatase
MKFVGRPRYLFAGILAFLFALLTVGVELHVSDSFDLSVRTYVHSWSFPTLSVLAFSLSFVGSTAVVGFLTVSTATVLYHSNSKRAAISLIWCMSAAVLLNNLLKYSFRRARPDPFYGVNPESFSFPSGHALYAASFYILLSLIIARVLERRALKIGIVLAAGLIVVCVGGSRIYLGVHYPTDVMGGFLIGGVLLSFVKL